MSTGLYLGYVKVFLHDRGVGAVSYEEKGTWVYLVTSAGAYAVYLGFVLWALAGSVLKLVAYRRGL
jgi:hypothetical protein